MSPLTNGISNGVTSHKPYTTSRGARNRGSIDLDSDMRMHEGSRELFDLCTQLHKASLLDLAHVGLVDIGTAKRIAGAIAKVTADHDCPEAAISLDYLDFESRMAELIGSEASLLHLGRSRQDLLSTYNRQTLRIRTLAIMEALNKCRHKILDVATKHAEAVVPMYTHGVPAQPTTFGHYLLAYAEAFERTYERLLTSYRSVNLSPFGTAVGGASSFPLDRHYLASLLGFDGVVENSFGANHVASVDAIQDATSPLTVLALHVGTIAQDMTAVQATVHPWLSTATPGYVGPSSTMPQKRNPRILEYIRECASEVFAGNHTASIITHNCMSGLTDTRETFSKLPLKLAVEMLGLCGELFDSVDIDKEQALYQVTHDYSTVTQIADVLFSTYKVPFRIGHHFASRLVDLGRSKSVGPTEIGYDSVKNIYSQVANNVFPMTKEEFSDCLCPTKVVQSRKGFGGPQITEVSRMLLERKQTLKRDDCILHESIDRLEQADSKLNEDFNALVMEADTNGRHE